MATTDRADKVLIEGEAGPFYVALNRPAFYLVTAIFVMAVPIALYLLRDVSAPVAVAVALGIGIESGTIAHILVERVMCRPARLAWSAHAFVGAAVAAAAMLFVLA